MILILKILITLLLATTTTNTSDIEASNFYTINTIVSEIDLENDVVYYVDFDGEEWSYEDVEDWEEGDKAVLTMYDNKTETIYDDIIVNARYIR